MKRLIISLIILAGIAGLCQTSLSIQKQSTDTLLVTLDEMEKAYRQEEKETCKALAITFTAQIQKVMKRYSLFLPHEELSEIQELAVALPVILEQEEDSHFAPDLAQCRFLLQRLQNAEHPVWSNIL